MNDTETDMVSKSENSADFHTNQDLSFHVPDQQNQRRSSLIVANSVWKKIQQVEILIQGYDKLLNCAQEPQMETITDKNRIGLCNRGSNCKTSGDYINFFVSSSDEYPSLTHTLLEDNIFEYYVIST
ncbi:hypothetical protein TNCV_2112771 [Trichonephila clavipes]|nr:hypothetical protein TNCV_2112771 [Trichonephila clavipes]